MLSTHTPSVLRSRPVSRLPGPGCAVALLALASLLAGCAAPSRIDAEIAPAADFSARRTFAWQESQASYDPKPRKHDVEQVKQAIHQAVVTQLARKGYSEASDKQADFLVSFHLVVTESEAPDLCVRRYTIFDLPASTTPINAYEICRLDPIMMRRTLRKGTLVVFVVDSATRSLLWQGVADNTVVSRTNQIEKLRSAVERMFVAFPAEKA